ncbi:dentin matrix acidic phosphoprotein 1 isoform X4 [Dicentrarchus labrax]|uniref:dentin matrix acidic phosphoprotein 1 isoform X4 n=1 Tax=Dicentrarchus labrax TaxID=13489 RepID=UPI0021F55059|nr:dentin matrix acidic phosphoprotein 1 isoform X4 [Dicentrarchus labrax]
MAPRFFVAYFIFTSGLVAGVTVYQLKGEEFSFKPHITGQPNNILWKHNGNKVVEFDGIEQQEYSTYKDRVILDWHAAVLNISDLRFDDSGDYELEAFKPGGNLESSRFNLMVIDKVAKPIISCEMNNGSIISGTLMCSAEPRHPPSLMKFEWSSSGDVQPGPKLTINLGEKLDDEVYTCSVSNPLSTETGTFTAKDCYPADKSSNVAAIVISILLLLFIIIGLAVFCIIKKKACTRKGNDLENQLLRGPPEETKLLNGRPEEGMADKDPGREEEGTPWHGSGESEEQSDLSTAETGKGTECNVKLLEKGNVAAKRKMYESENGGDANPQQFIGEPEKNNPESDSSSCEKRNGPESDGSEHEADDEPKDTAGEHKEKPDSNELAVEAARESDSLATEENQSSTVPDRSGSETSVHDQDSSLSQEQTHTREENQQETGKPVSGDENQKLPVSPSQQPQSPKPTTPGSGESEEQSDLITAEAGKGNVAARRKIYEPENGGDANPQQFIGEPEKNNPESDSSSCEKRNGPESDGSEHEADDEPKDTAGEHKEKPDSNELAVEAARESDSLATEENQSSTVPDRSGSETSVHDQDSSLSQEQTHTREENQQETGKPVSGDENQKLPVSPSQQPQSPKPTTPGSGESEEQSDLITAEAGNVAARRKIYEPENGGDANPQQFIGEPEKNNPESDSSSCEKRNGPESDGSEHEADDEPKDTAGEHKEKPDSNELAVEAARESDSLATEENKSSTVPDRSGSETSVHDQDSSLSQEQTHTREENQQETGKPVSGDENQKLPVSPSQQPQSPKPTTPGSGESEEQSDLSTAEEDKGTECNVKRLEKGYVVNMKNKFESN